MILKAVLALAGVLVEVVPAEQGELAELPVALVRLLDQNQPLALRKPADPEGYSNLRVNP
jgi:hypothetical protein